MCGCVCVCQFFQKRGVSEAMSVYELFNAVSGLNVPFNEEKEEEFLTEVGGVSGGRGRSQQRWRQPPGAASHGADDLCVCVCDRSWCWRRGTRTTFRRGRRKALRWRPRTVARPCNLTPMIKPHPSPITLSVSDRRRKMHTHTPARPPALRLVSRWDAAAAAAAPPAGRGGDRRASRRFHDGATTLLYFPEKLFCDYYFIFGVKLKLNEMKLWRLQDICVAFTVRTMVLKSNTRRSS